MYQWLSLRTVRPALAYRVQWRVNALQFVTNLSALWYAASNFYIVLLDHRLLSHSQHRDDLQGRVKCVRERLFIPLFKLQILVIYFLEYWPHKIRWQTFKALLETTYKNKRYKFLHCQFLCCVHTGRDAMFGGSTITCKVNAETRTDANSLRRRAWSGWCECRGAIEASNSRDAILR